MCKQFGSHPDLYIIAVMFLALGGCGGGPAKVEPMAIDSDAGDKALAQLDANKDGKLDYNELAKAPGLREGVASIKKLQVFRGPPPSPAQVQAATITAEEINARVQEWKSQGVGRIAVACRVVRKSKNTKNKAAPLPVAGAEVKFIPESFQGSGLTTATGTTDGSGFARVSQPSRGANDLGEGMSPGYYRVEISKGSEIPANYNSATTLGAEVAPDASGSKNFELEY